MFGNFFKIFLFFCVFFNPFFSPSLFPVNAAGPLNQPSVILNKSQDSIVLGPYLEILEDAKGNYTVDQMNHSSIRRQFKPSQKKIPGFGFSSSVFWVRFEIENPYGETLPWILEFSYPIFNLIEFYVISGSKISPAQVCGTRIPFHHREISYRNFLFQGKSEPFSRKTVILRLQSNTSINLPLTLWNPSQFVAKISEDMAFLGFFNGTLGMMILFSLFLFFTVKEKAYLYFSFSALSSALFLMVLDGIAFEYLWPSTSSWVNQSLVVFMGLGLGGFSLFSVEFLQISKKNRFQLLIYRIFLVLNGISVLSAFIFPYSWAIQYAIVITILTCIFLLVSGLTRFRENYRPALYFLLAFTFFYTGCILFSLKSLGILPNIFFMSWVMHLGVLLLLLFFSLALGKRYQILKKEQQKQILLRLQESEKVLELNRKLEKYNATLAQRVREKTLEVEESKNFIESVLENSPMAILALDQSGKIILANRAYEKILGYEGSRILGSCILEWDSVKQSNLPHWFEKTFQGESFYLESVPLRSEVTQKEMLLNISMAPVLNQNGEISVVVAMLHDNTEKAMAELFLKEDLKLAQQIQTSLIHRNEKTFSGLEIRSFFQPMMEVGGDIYHIYEIRPGYIRIFLADATGHGIQAALSTIIIRNEYEKIKDAPLLPHEVLSVFNEGFYHSYYHLSLYFTCVLVDIDLTANQIFYASAGHPPQILDREGKFLSLHCAGKMIGLKEKEIYALLERDFPDHARLILFTDGLVEEINPENEEYGEERLRKIIEENRENSLSAALDSVMRNLSVFSGKKTRNDDITMVAVERNQEIPFEKLPE